MLYFVRDALRTAKHTYSAGLEGVPASFWVNVADAVAFPVSILFQLSYSFSVLPNDWKCANVLPISKMGNPSAMNNYRPISLSNTLCKVN